MPGKDIRQLRIDARPAIEVSISTVTSAAPLPPAITSVPPPTGLALATYLGRSAATPTSIIVATWTPPPGDPSKVVVQWSQNSSFPVGNETQAQETAVGATGATIENLTPNTLYYVRVASIFNAIQSAWSPSASITTAQDTTAPSPPSAQAAAFVGTGDLVITWTNPTSANFRDVEIGIYSDSSKTTQYALIYNATQRYIWTAQQNLDATSQAGDRSLYVELRSRSWSGVFSTAVNTGTITKALPSTPSGLTTSWAGDGGTAGPDLTISWTEDLTVARYVLTIDGVARTIKGPATRYTYTLDTNRAEHSGTADPTIASIILAAYDGINQANASSASATATNVAPTPPTVTLLGGAMSLLVCRVTSNPVADFAAYEYVWKRDGSTVRTQESTSAQQSYEAGGAGDQGVHSWTCVVRQKDAFGQYSSTTVSSAVVLDTLTIAYLREGAYYTDSEGSSNATLAVLKDNIFTTGGVTIAA